MAVKNSRAIMKRANHTTFLCKNTRKNLFHSLVRGATADANSTVATVSGIFPPPSHTGYADQTIRMKYRQKDWIK